MTTDTVPTILPTSVPTPLGVARALSAELDARAAENEAAGTLAPDLVDRLRAGGVFRLLQPEALGGTESEPAAYVEVIEELSRADGSAGWVATIGAGASAFTAWLDPGVARSTFGADADLTAAAVFAPVGRFAPLDAERFSCSGRWPFASGCRHAEWFVMGGFVTDGGAPRMLPGVGPDWRLAWFSREQGEIVPDWDVLGLRATGSNDVVAEGVVVPAELMMRPFHEPARHDGALWRLPFFTLAGICLVGVPLGIARRALDEIALIAPTKVRTGASAPIADDDSALQTLASADARLRAARAFVFDAIDALWTAAHRGDEPSVAQRARFRSAAIEAMDTSVRAVDAALELAGSSAVRNDHPVLRCFRDIHTASQHAYFNRTARRRIQRVELGADESTFML